MTQGAVIVSADGVGEVVERLGALPKQVAIAGARTFYDLHNPRSGFVRRRLISRLAPLFRNRSVGRRFAAAKMDEGGEYHRLPGELSIKRIQGETFSYSEELETFIAGARRNPSGPELVPAFDWGTARPADRRRFRQLSSALKSRGLELALDEVSKGNKQLHVIPGRSLIAAKVTRRGKLSRSEPVAKFRKRGPTRQTLNITQTFSDLAGKALSILEREIAKVIREDDKQASLASGVRP